jgi:hypothetical protein
MAVTERKVLFFTVNTKDNDINDQDESFEEVCEKIMKLGPTDRVHQIAQSGPDEFLRLLMFEKRPEESTFYSGVFVKYRTNNITVGKETEDEIRDFQLTPGLRPTEITHFIYSPKTRILAIEYNHNGPKHMQFINYINVMQRKHGMEVIYFVPEVLNHPDIVAEIKKSQYIKSIELAIPRSEVPTDKQQNDWLKAMAAAANIGKPGTISLKLAGAVRRGDKSPLMTSSQLASKLENGDIDLKLFGTAKVQAMMDYGSETINLLQNKIDSTIKVPSTKTVDHVDEFFEAIRAVYTANKDLLVKASHIEASD